MSVANRAADSHVSGCSAIRPENARRSGSSNWSDRIANGFEPAGVPSRTSRRLSRSQARSSSAFSARLKCWGRNEPTSSRPRDDSRSLTCAPSPM